MDKRVLWSREDDQVSNYIKLCEEWAENDSISGTAMRNLRHRRIFCLITVPRILTM